MQVCNWEETIAQSWLEALFTSIAPFIYLHDVCWSFAYGAFRPGRFMGAGATALERQSYCLMQQHTPPVLSITNNLEN